MKEKALAGKCRQSPGPRNESQERSILSEFLPPPVLNTGDVFPDMVPEKGSGQDKPPLSACCSSALCKSPP